MDIVLCTHSAIAITKSTGLTWFLTLRNCIEVKKWFQIFRHIRDLATNDHLPDLQRFKTIIFVLAWSILCQRTQIVHYLNGDPVLSWLVLWHKGCCTQNGYDFNFCMQWWRKWLGKRISSKKLSSEVFIEPSRTGKSIRRKLMETCC
jgi:hypothetical protein